MNYFQSHSLSANESIISAWDSQLTRAARSNTLARELAAKSAELFPLFAARYAELQSLPRGARRALARRLARSKGFQIPTEWQCRLAGSLAGAALLLALAQTGEAATINVNTTDPSIKADGKCSLIEAIVNANDDAATHPDCLAGSGADTIVLPPNGTHVLTNSDANYSTNGLPVITSQVTIEGNGGKITRSATRMLFRLITVDGTGNLIIHNLTVSGGRAGNRNRPGWGGGVLVIGGSLTVIDSTISGNAAAAVNYSQGGGGGIASHHGNVSVINSRIVNNTVRGFIPCSADCFGQTAAARGGGIYNFGGYILVEDSDVSNNLASGVNTGSGGAVFSAYGTVAVRNSTISGNLTESIRIAAYGAGVSATSGELIIENSLIAGNTAISQGSAHGGGVLSRSAGGLIYNSTISGNVAKASADHQAHGGGLHGYSLTIENSTITSNRTIGGSVGYNRGGGLYGSHLTLSRNLIAGNAAAAGREVHVGFAAIAANDFNLFGFDGDAGVVGLTPGTTDIVPPAGLTLNEIIGPLQNNQGPTKTHALVAGSPAIDAVPLGDPGCTGTDQRGVPRPQGGGCDIGAFEK